jgi:hypothetical protein
MVEECVPITGRSEGFISFFKVSRPSLEPTQSPSEKEHGIFLRLNRPKREDGHSYVSSSEMWILQNSNLLRIYFWCVTPLRH